MNDQERLAGYVETWWSAVGDFTALLEDLAPEDWTRPTDLPGWSVHDVAAHTAHLEHVSVGGTHDEVAGIEIGTPAHVRSMMSVFTEQGVVARRDVPPAELIAAIRRDTAQRHEQLLAGLPDPAAPADGVFGAIGWTWQQLLRNRPLDVWMHEQDIRRAVDRAGNIDAPGAQHSADYLAEAFPVIVGKRVSPPAGTTAVLAVEGSPVMAVQMDADGRAQRLAEEPAEPTARIAMDRETFLNAAGGRRPARLEAVTITGDADLAAAILDQLATTP